MVCDANSTPPFLFQMPPCKGRKVLEEAHGAGVDASVAWINRKNKMDGDCRHRGI